MSNVINVLPGPSSVGSFPVVYRAQQSQPLEVAAPSGQPLEVTFGSSAVISTRPYDSAALDAFQRSRVSNPVTLFESSMEVDSQTLLWESVVTGSGGSAYNSNQSSVTLTTGAASSSSVRQSYQYVRYQPGKSLMTLFTFVLGARATGVTRRVGYFDSSNGVFLEQTANDIAWVIRSNTTGSSVDTRVVQSQWDVDKLDGTGVSGLTLDETSANIGIVDMEWLGVGRVRAGFVLNGQIYYTHGFENLGVNKVYMSRASLPMRYEIVSGVGASGSSSLVQICSTVISEGGYVPRGMIRAAGTGATHTTVGSVTRLPIVAIRLRSAYLRSMLYPIEAQIANASGSLCHFDLRMRATVTGGAWTQVSEAVEMNITGTGVSGGYVIGETYADNNKRVGDVDISDTTLVNSASISGTAHIIVLTALSLSGNVNISASLQWREIF